MPRLHHGVAVAPRSGAGPFWVRLLMGLPVCPVSLKLREAALRAEAPCMRIATARAPYAIACSPLHIALVGAGVTIESIQTVLSAMPARAMG